MKQYEFEMLKINLETKQLDINFCKEEDKIKIYSAILFKKINLHIL